MTVNEPKIKIKVVPPPKCSSKEKGDFWEDVSADLFRQQQWEVTPNIGSGGMQTDLRVVSFSGNSGFGKSSLVLKLASECGSKSENEDKRYDD